VSDRKIILLGYSGHGIVVADTALDNQLDIVGYTEKSASSFNPFHLDYLGHESDSEFIGWAEDVDFLIGIGDNSIRERIFKLVLSKEKIVRTLIHASSSISKFSELGIGVFINRNVVINAFARIGNNVLLNTGCIIEHECLIGDSVHIAPGAVLAGNVEIGERTFIGANAVIKHGIKIGKNVVVGAGSVVLENIPEGKRIVGNPSRFI
jgi:sugar O-acyltransferase (sialic acid O-acetyltransferase NeuD family)